MGKKNNAHNLFCKKTTKKKKYHQQVSKINLDHDTNNFNNGHPCVKFVLTQHLLPLVPWRTYFYIHILMPFMLFWHSYE